MALIDLTGAAGINTLSASAEVQLDPLSDSGTPDELQIDAGTNVVLDTIAIANLLDINVDTGGGSSTLMTNQLSAGTITVDGTGTNDTFTFSGNGDATDGTLGVESTTGDVTINQANEVNLDDDVTGAMGVTVSNVNTVLDLGGDVDVTASGGNLDLNNSVTLIDLEGGGGTTNILSASAEVQLDPLSDSGTPDELQVDAGTNVVLDTIAIANLLDINVDTGGGSSTLMTNQLSAGTITVDGTGTNDTFTFSGNGDATDGTLGVESTTGDVTINQANEVNLDDDVTGAMGVTVSNVNTVLDLGGDVDVTASGGNLDLNNSVTLIDLEGGGGTTNILSASAEVQLDPLSDSGTPDELQVDAGTNVVLDTISIANLLDINVDTGADGSSTLTSNQLSAGTITVDGQGTNDTFTFSGNGDATDGTLGVESTTGDVTINQVNQLNLDDDVTAALGLTISNVTTQVDLAGNVDLTATNGVLDAFTGVANIDLSGAGGTANVIDGNGDNLVTLGAITDTSPDSLTINSEGDIDLVTIDIDGILNINLDNDNDDVGVAGANARTATGTSVSGSGVNLVGGTDGNDIFDIDLVVTPGVDIIFNSTLVLTKDTAFSTGAGAIGDIIFNFDVVTDTDNDHVLTLTSGLGDVVFNSNVGENDGALVNGAGELGGLVITDADEVMFVGGVATVDVLQLSIGSVTAVTSVDFDGVVRVDGAGGVDINTGTFTLDATIDAAAGGGVTVTNTGAANVNAKITGAGGITFDSTGQVNLGADLEATDAGAGISIATSILQVTGGNRRLDANVGAIMLDEIADDGSNRNLTLDAGGTGAAADITIDDNVASNGSELGTFTIEAADEVLFSGAAATVDVQALTIGSVTPVTSVEFDGVVNVDGSVDINTGVLTADATLDTNSSGTVTVTNTAAANVNAKITSAGGITFDSTGQVNLGADLEATDAGAGISIATSTLQVTGGNRRLDANVGAITLDEIADDGSNRDLALDAGGTGAAADITVDDNVASNGSELGTFTIEAADQVLFSGAAATVDVQALTIGSVTPVTSVEFDGVVVVDGSVDINTGTFTAGATLDTNSSGTVTVTNTGAANVNAKITGAGGITFDSTGQVNLGGDLEATDAGAGISIATSTLQVIGGNRRVDTNVGAIMLDEIVDDGSNRNLTLDAGGTGAAADITIDDNVASNGSELGTFTIEAADEVLFSGAAATVDVQALAIGSVTPVTSVEFDGVVNVDGSVDINTGVLTADAALDTNSSGTVTVTNTGAANVNAKITGAGGITFDGTGQVNLSADLEATDAGAGIDVATSTLQVTGGNRRVDTNVGAIMLDEIADDGSNRNLTLDAGGTGAAADITIDDNVASNGSELGALTIEEADEVLFSGAAATVDVDALTIGSVSPVTSVEFDGVVNVDGPVDINTGAFTADATLDTNTSGTVTVTNTGAANVNAKITGGGGSTSTGSVR